jgi:maltose/moltooligosaccharide transporter
MEKPPLKGLQLANMSVGFFGIQFGWSLQMANMSAIFEYLGAEAHQIPVLWLAGPLTGLVVQPIIGSMSDNTWGWLGRRRPYFLTGAICSSLALVAMPNVSALWMAAGLLWILDTGANVSMEPFRAFVGDILPEQQHTRGYAVQSIFIGLGAVLASSLPWVLSHTQLAAVNSGGNTVPLIIKLSFYLGATVFLGSVLWTICTTQEYPPENLEEFRQNRQRLSLISLARSISSAVYTMPPVMRQLAWVQVFSWLGFFCIFLYFPPAIAHHIFGAESQTSPIYTAGIAWAGLCLAIADAVCCLVSFLLTPVVSRFGASIIYALCLFCGAISLISLVVVPDQYWLFLPMVGLGIARSGILALPYSMLARALPPDEIGIYMGLFNAFIVIPQIIVALGVGWILSHWLGDNLLMVLFIGGSFMMIGSLFSLGIKEQSNNSYSVFEKSSELPGR